MVSNGGDKTSGKDRDSKHPSPLLSTPPKPAPRTLKNKRILLVDDTAQGPSDDSIGNSVYQRLSESGVEITTAGSTNEAIDGVKGNRYDVIVINDGGEGEVIDGDRLLQQMRDEELRRGTPVVVYTDSHQQMQRMSGFANDHKALIRPAMTPNTITDLTGLIEKELKSKLKFIVRGGGEAGKWTISEVLSYFPNSEVRFLTREGRAGEKDYARAEQWVASELESYRDRIFFNFDSPEEAMSGADALIHLAAKSESKDMIRKAVRKLERIKSKMEQDGRKKPNAREQAQINEALNIRERLHEIESRGGTYLDIARLSSHFEGNVIIGTNPLKRIYHATDQFQFYQILDRMIKTGDLDQELAEKLKDENTASIALDKLLSDDSSRYEEMVRNISMELNSKRCRRFGLANLHTIRFIMAIIELYNNNKPKKWDPIEQKDILNAYALIDHGGDLMHTGLSPVTIGGTPWNELRFHGRNRIGKMIPQMVKEQGLTAISYTGSTNPGLAAVQLLKAMYGEKDEREPTPALSWLSGDLKHHQCPSVELIQFGEDGLLQRVLTESEDYAREELGYSARDLIEMNKKRRTMGQEYKTYQFKP